MNMKKLFRLLTLAALVLLAKPANAQLIEGPRGYEDFKIGVAGYTYRSYDIDQTLAFLKSMEVHYMSVKDWWLPLDSTKEQMDAFKAKCREYDVEPYILGPIYMRSEAEVDRAFAYAERYGSDVFIGVPNY
jgi:sugar phosphate isomerase/epimerase